MDYKKTQEAQAFYGVYYEDMLLAQQKALQFINALGSEGDKLFEHCISRIKAPDSMMKKLQKQGESITAQAALTRVTDAVGIRIICGFLNDVQRIAEELQHHSAWCVLKAKDYIAYPKPNGYRSYHIVVQVPGSKGIAIPVEIQIRTIAQDSWASLEHQMKYKKQIPHQHLIQQELKRCADEMASTDISMQTIRELIAEFQE